MTNSTLRVLRLVVVFGIIAALGGTRANAQVTSLIMTSDPGDYIGGGQFYFYTPPDSTFTVPQSSVNQVSFSVNGANMGEWWTVEFAAPAGQSLVPGSYTGAARFPFQEPTQPGLSVYGEGRGCNTLTGSFEVVQSEFDQSGNVLGFYAIFVQHCEGGEAALNGEIRYNASAAVALAAPTRLNAITGQYLSFVVTATSSMSSTVHLSATGLPDGATFLDNADNSATFAWTPSAAQTGEFLICFTGTDQLGNTSATYTRIKVVAPPPANDELETATLIPSIGFSMSQDVSSATAAPDDPWCYGMNQTVWFVLTPSSNVRLEANTFGSDYDTTLSVYSGTRGALVQHACNDDANGLQSRVRFDAIAGTTYYFMVASLSPSAAVNLVFTLVTGPPPFSFSAAVSQFGQVKPSDGSASVLGAATCTSPAPVNIWGELKQTRGGASIVGYFSGVVQCDGTTAWSLTVQPSQIQLFHGRSVALFAGGKATVAGTALAFDQDAGTVVWRNFTVDITLRGAR